MQLTMAFAYWQKETKQEEAHEMVGKEQEKLVDHLLSTFPSERNRRLIKTLRARRSQFQVFYPAEHSGSGEDREVAQLAADAGGTFDKQEANKSKTKTKTATTNNRIRFRRAPIESSSIGASNFSKALNSSFRVSSGIGWPEMAGVG